jgi:glutamine cyclotransferase
MKYKITILIAGAVFVVCGFFSCKSGNQSENNVTITPEAGSNYKTGDKVAAQAHYPAGTKADSIVYLLDSVRIASTKDTSAITVKTDTMRLGARIITAKVYSGGKSEDASTNIVLLPAKAPVKYSFKVIKTFPHDTSSFTEGLVYQDGFLYESGGGYLKPPQGQEVTNQSSLRKVDLNTGKVLQKVLLDSAVFGEGISIVGNKILQLTYHEKIGYIYDKSTFKKLGTFPNNIGIEGWGMCFDGNKLYMDDSSNRLWFLDKNTYKAIGYVDVYDDKGPVDKINELEYIDGKIYADIWTTNTIVIIDPKTGAVIGKIDLTDLYPQDKRIPGSDVLNGIAYDPQGKRIFITGKKWPALYQVEFNPLAP